MITTRKVYCGTANESLVQALSLRSHFKKSVLKFVFQLHHERVIFAAIILMWLFCSVNRAAFGLSFSMDLCNIERRWSVRMVQDEFFFKPEHVRDDDSP